MADVISKKYAIIINPDSEVRHLQNVEDSVTVLEQNGYETHVFNPSKPATPHDQYHSTETTNEYLQELQKIVTANDEVLIYSSGHGAVTESGQPQLCIDDVCGEQDVFSLLSFQQAKKRTIIMDQCFSGGYAKQFATQPNTLFISPGSEGQSVICNQFAPYFWSQSATDYNSDGTVSFQERYQFALDQNHTETKSQFIPTMGYKDEGGSPFPSAVQNITTAAELSSQLATLKPGQFAFVLFSASWCGPCKTYKPQFESISASANGQYLFIRTENEELAEEYNIVSYPTVKIIDHTGKATEVADRNQVFASLQFTTTTQATLYQNTLTLLRSTQADDHHAALTQLQYLSSGLNEKQATLAINSMQAMLATYGDMHSISEMHPVCAAIYSDFIYTIPRVPLMEIVDSYILPLLDTQSEPKTSDLILLSILANKASPSMRARFVAERDFTWLDHIQNSDRKTLAAHALHLALDTHSIEEQDLFFLNWAATLPSLSIETRMEIYKEYTQHFISPESIVFVIEDSLLFMLTATPEQLQYAEPHEIFISFYSQRKFTTAQIDSLLLRITSVADQLPSANLGYALTTMTELSSGATPTVQTSVSKKVSTFMESTPALQTK